MQAAGQVGLVHSDLENMSVEVKKGFVENNFHFMPMKSLMATMGDSLNFDMDPRSFMGTWNSMLQQFALQTAAMLNQRDELRSLQGEIQSIKGNRLIVLLILNMLQILYTKSLSL